MEALKIVLLVLEVIASVVLIAIVLMQSGKEAGLSGALSGNSDSYMNRNGKGGLDKALAKATKWVALVWLLLTLALYLLMR
jgi:preprotein translocase subunit SecG